MITERATEKTFRKKGYPNYADTSQLQIFLIRRYYMEVATVGTDIFQDKAHMNVLQYGFCYPALSLGESLHFLLYSGDSL